MLFGGYLSEHNDVWLIDIDQNRIDYINANGVAVRESTGEDKFFRPVGMTNAANLGELQNGAGHESKLLQFADADHVIIGSTQHNSSIIGNGHVNHGGSGRTQIGLLSGDSSRLESIAQNFSACGFACSTSADVKRQIWTKLFTNTAASSLTAVLQVPLGFIHEDTNAHKMMETLAREAVAVANADCGGGFDEAEVIEGVDTVCRNAPNGYTSIYADVQAARHRNAVS